MRESPVVKRGFIPSSDEPAVLPPHDRLKLWLTAVAVVFVGFALMGLYAFLLGR